MPARTSSSVSDTVLSGGSSASGFWGSCMFPSLVGVTFVQVVRIVYFDFGTHVPVFRAGIMRPSESYCGSKRAWGHDSSGGGSGDAGILGRGVSGDPGGVILSGGVAGVGDVGWHGEDWGLLIDSSNVSPPQRDTITSCSSISWSFELSFSIGMWMSPKGLTMLVWFPGNTHSSNMAWLDVMNHWVKGFQNNHAFVPLG